MEDHLAQWRRRLLALLASIGVPRAAEGPLLDAGPPLPQVDPSELDPRVRAAAEALDKIDNGAPATPESLSIISEACGLNPAVQSIAMRIKPFPAEMLVNLLAHPKFAVRMGALEILEAKSGDDFGFDPWEPSGDRSQAALGHWRSWLKPKKDDKPADEKADAKEQPLDDAKLRGYFADLAGSDVSKHERAVAALARQAMPSVAALEQYLHDTPQLSEGVRAKLKEAQYRLVIHEALPKESAKLGRQLVFGTRDLKLEALRDLPRLHEKAVPIIAEFLPDPDALIREAAMDALIVAAEESVYDLVEQRLKAETDENVVHAVLRRVSTKTPRGAQLLASFVTASNEDLAVAALNALSDGASNEAAAKLKQCLTDKRWRVRVAALEYAGKIKSIAAKPDVVNAFGDSDEFVRYAAMKAAADMGLKDAVPLITKMALADDSMVGPAVEAIVRMGQPLPEDLVKALPSKPGDVLLVVLRAFGQHAGHDGEQIEFELLENDAGGGDNSKRTAAEQALKILRSLAVHRDADVRAAALHLLGQHLVEPGDKKLTYDALKSAPDDDARASLLAGIRPGGFDFRESTLPETPDAESKIVADANDVFASVLAEPAPRNPAQEAVYAAFGVKLPEPEAPAVTVTTSGARIWQPMDKEFGDLLTAGMESKNGDMAFLCAMHLALGGQGKAAEGLLRMLPRLEPHQRAHVADLLSASTHLTRSRMGQPLLRALLQDESQEVRQSTVWAMLAKGTPSSVRVILDEVAAPDSKLHPKDAYGYSLSQATTDLSKRNAIVAWSKDMLADAQTSVGVKTLALTLLGTTGSKDIAALVEGHLQDPNVWQRRAAWRSWWRLSRTEFESMAPTLAADASPRVREVLPAGFMKAQRREFEVWFGERESEDETAPYTQARNRFALSEGMEPLLRKLAADPDAMVRLESMVALLSWRRDVEPLALREGIAALTEEERHKVFINLFADNGWTQLGPRYGFLLDYVEPKWFAYQWKQIVAVLRPAGVKNAKPLTSFASLVKEEPVTPRAEEAAPPSATQPVQTPPRGGVEVVFFYKTGCKECEHAREILHDIAKVVDLKLLQSDVETSEGAQWNEALCQRFEVDSSLHQIGPAVFTQAGALVKTEITPGALQRLIDRTLETPVQPGWHAVTSPERAGAGAHIESRYSRFSFGLVLSAGLIDGINPCAFATIIFFLSYLHIARRRPHEILLVGAAFILAVYITSFCVGLGLSRVIAKAEAFSWVHVWLTRALAVFALILAWLSFRDGLRARRGKLAEMSLQMPDYLKSRIRGVIREQSRASHFILAAFVSGIVVSLLGLACTGQIYLPTLVYMVNQGSISAMLWLLFYNLAYIVPLVIVFLLAYTGIKSDALIQWQKKHTALVRFATGFLFLVLWMVLMIT